MKFSARRSSFIASIPQARRLGQLGGLLVLMAVAASPARAADPLTLPDVERFRMAWNAASRGDRHRFRQIKPSLEGYVLYPYLQYEDYRDRRSSVAVDEMAAFLDRHRDWAFTEGLRVAWLRSLAKRGKWPDLVAHSVGVSDTELRCQRLRGRIRLGDTDGALEEARALWTVGKSQPRECDPVFKWMIDDGGVPETLAWERIWLAMQSGNWRLTMYLERFVSTDGRRWLEQWRALHRSGYGRVGDLRRWPDNEVTARIAAISVRRLARSDPDRAGRAFRQLEGHFDWDGPLGAGLLRDIAFHSAVDMGEHTGDHMVRVPAGFRDTQLLEWWARFLLGQEDWTALEAVIGQMPADLRDHDRWRYWGAQAARRNGHSDDANAVMEDLARKASYYGFLAADQLGTDYSICPRQAQVDEAEVDRVARTDGFTRALELRRAGLGDWAVREWSRAADRVPTPELKSVAALARREGWHDRVISALGNSGDLRIYEWRFPLAWEADVLREAAAWKLDPAWIYGTMRSESAMLETARSSANALGLMQVTPATGRRVARKHNLAWKGSAQLKTAQGNLPIAAAHLSDLLGEFGNNPVLASGSYNAGANAVRRWLDTRPGGEAAIWVETLPYFETRDYIPRVLAFTTIYDWRLGGDVKRISVRMPHIESGNIGVQGYTKVVCREDS